MDAMFALTHTGITVVSLWLCYKLVQLFICSEFKFSLTYSNTPTSVIFLYLCNINCSINCSFILCHCNDCTPFTTVLLLSIPSLKTRYLKVFYFIFLISSICTVALKMELLFVVSDSDLLISVLSFIYGYKVIMISGLENVSCPFVPALLHFLV